LFPAFGYYNLRDLVLSTCKRNMFNNERVQCGILDLMLVSLFR